MRRPRRLLKEQARTSASDCCHFEVLETRVLFDATAGVWLKNGIVHVQLTDEFNHVGVTTFIVPDPAGIGSDIPIVGFQPFGDTSKPGQTIGKHEEIRLADIKSVVIHGADTHSFVKIWEWEFTDYDFKIHLTGERKDYSVFRIGETQAEGETLRALGVEGMARLLNGNADDVIAVPNPEPVDLADPTPVDDGDEVLTVDKPVDNVIATPQFKLTPYVTQVLPDDRVDGHVWD